MDILLASFLLALSFLAFAGFVNYKRLKTTYQINLKPNCLLTSYPIVFIPGPFSVFYFGNYWNFIPTLLKKHGYHVLQTKSNSKQTKKLSSEFQQLISDHTKVYILFDESQAKDFRMILNEYPQFKPLSWLITNKNSNSKTQCFSLKLAQEQPSLLYSITLLAHRYLTGYKLNPNVLGLAKPKILSEVASKYLILVNLLAESEY